MVDEVAEQAAQPELPGILINQAVPTTNKRADAPTVYADSVQGAMLSGFTTKITFLEHFIHDQEEPTGRYVLNLVVPTPQLRAMGELFVRLAGELEAALGNNG